MPDTLFTSVQHPASRKYQTDRRRQINECLKMSESELSQLYQYMKSQPPLRDDDSMISKIIGEMYSMPFLPAATKGILDSTSGTGGNVLLRQDLEPILYAIFVRNFPVFDRLKKKPANGLVHVANQITAADTGSLGSTLISEVGTVSYTAGSYNRLTFPIGVFATGRGISLKEIAAANAGGSPYDPGTTEMDNGMTKLATDLQYFLLQGNASNSSGAGASTEKGAYNANGVDGLRGTLGSVGSFSGNGATQVDISSLNITESLRFAATQGANNGGHPNLALLTLNSAQAFDDEQMTNVRYDSQANLRELIPGTKARSLTYSNGELLVVPFPGNTNGTYNRSSDNALVEDMYVLDESTCAVPWLYSESFTILQIPSGVDGVLSQRWIIFAMYGFEIAAPSFDAKVRRLAS